MIAEPTIKQPQMVTIIRYILLIFLGLPTLIGTELLPELGLDEV